MWRDGSGRQVKRVLNPVRVKGSPVGLSKTEANEELRKLMSAVRPADTRVTPQSMLLTVKTVGDLIGERQRLPPEIEREVNRPNDSCLGVPRFGRQVPRDTCVVGHPVGEPRLAVRPEGVAPAFPPEPDAKLVPEQDAEREPQGRARRVRVPVVGADPRIERRPAVR